VAEQLHEINRRSLSSQGSMDMRSQQGALICARREESEERTGEGGDGRRGIGGLSAAQHLNRNRVDVPLIDRRNYHLFQPLRYRAAPGPRLGKSACQIASFRYNRWRSGKPNRYTMPSW
jgi:hypothetical protein